MKKRHGLNLLEENSSSHICSFNFLQNPNLFVYSLEDDGFYIRNMKQSGKEAPVSYIKFSEFIDFPLDKGGSGEMPEPD